MILADVWKTAPFMALLLLAGLQGIPDELTTRPRSTAPTTWQRFRSITLPLLVPGDHGGADLPHAGRAAHLRPALRADQGRERNRNAFADSPRLNSSPTAARASARRSPVLTFLTVMGVSFLYIRFIGGNIRALTEEHERNRSRATRRPIDGARRERRPLRARLLWSASCDLSSACSRSTG